MSKGRILGREAMVDERSKLRDRGESLVFTNGCFDLLHAGHVRYLERARALGDRLLVAVNTDETVRALKGEGRPVTPLADRMEVLAALRVVDYVIAFDERTPASVIEEILPDVLVKGGDWSLPHIVGRDVVEESGGRVVSLPFESGYSTTSLLERIRSRFRPE
ncbi:MAG TPA: D-glycero-beta-D-manno-heptose 1-phosphate adenylyltransferase [Vicinamibacteria bacterium]|nr:D-glycero-beta-D-manno-heptose 1-phosphate adenylyltransferase [Vicinamibacteria bacterium]